MMLGMETECWFRNPYHYIKELIEARAANIAWSRGTLVKRGIDPVAHAELYFRGQDYRLLVIGEQGAAELRRGNSMDRPLAVYPVWCYGDSFDMLETMFAHPAGEDEAACSDKGIPADERPVLGQPHRVVVMDLPPMNSAHGRRAVKEILALKEDYPEVVVHVHGFYGFKSAFGLGFDSVDVEPRTSAQKGKVILPNGKEMQYEQAGRYGQWLTLLGFTVGDLSVPRQRCIYNIKSALWAAEHYQENFKFRVSRGKPVDPDVSHFPAQTVTATRTSSQPVREGDKFLCDTCSIQTSCKYFREGAVCSVPGAQSKDLVRMFGTRNASQVIEGLHSLLQMQAERLEQGRHNEEVLDELDPEVTKIANGLFQNGVKLAKLLNPELAGGPKVGVFVNANSGGTAVSAGTPNAMVAGLVAQLEQHGIPREKITSEMLEEILTGNHENLAVAAGEIVDLDEQGR